MKILHVITSLRVGGAEKLMVDLLPNFKKLGNEVELFLFDGIDTPFKEQLEKAGIKIHVSRVEGNVYNPINILHLRKIINNYDIVHTHNTAPQLFAVLARAFCIKKSFILVTTEHNTTNRRRGNLFFKPIDKWMYSQYSKIICISKQAETNLRNYLNDDSSKIITIYNGIDVSRYSIGSNNTIIDNHKKEYVITMVAAFRQQKDQSTLIRAMSLLPDYFHLQLVGGGDSVLRDFNETLVKKLNLSERVNFMGMRTDIPMILHNTDIVVLSSHYEGLSLASLEGMASGKPFVASDVDGLREIVNGYGLLFPHEDAQALADILLSLSKDRAYADKIALKCQERAKQFDISESAKQYNEIYQDMIKKL